MICWLKLSWLIRTIKLIWWTAIILNVLIRLIIMFSIFILIINIFRNDLQRLSIRNLLQRQWKNVYSNIIWSRQIKLIWLIKMIVSLLILIKIELIRKLRLLKLAVWIKWMIIENVILITLLQLNQLCRLFDRFSTAIVLIELHFFYILHFFNE